MFHVKQKAKNETLINPYGFNNRVAKNKKSNQHDISYAK